MSVRIGSTRSAYTRLWHEVDVRDRILGRLATSIAKTLMGKHKPIFHPMVDCGDYVVAKNCSDFAVTGRKLDQHMYYSHSTKPGHLKTISMRKLMQQQGGGEVLRRAVSTMLPKNRLRKPRLARLKTFEGEDHPYIDNIVRRFDRLKLDETASGKAREVKSVSSQTTKVLS
ncbi:54S ribosomal protein L23, mitochondrial [Savitreella phatthalungensis]